jgi:hypothetical protein
MFWIAWLWPGRMTLAPTLLVCAILDAAGLWCSRASWRPDAMARSDPWSSRRRNPLLFVLAAAILLVSAGIVVNAAYWPFVDTDALAIYAPLGKGLVQTGSLPVGDLYEGYPMLVSGVCLHASGVGVNEHWAARAGRHGPAHRRRRPGREMRSARAGLIAAGAVVLTPLFNRWASSGYVDVPASFYFALSALAAWRWLESRAWQDALLTGIAAGLAMWTKSSALTLLVSLACLVLIQWWKVSRRSDGALSLRWGEVALLAGGLLATAAPWYVRNLTVLGFFLPDTAWTELAQRDLPTLLVMLRDWRQFQLSGWLSPGHTVCRRGSLPVGLPESPDGSCSWRSCCRSSPPGGGWRATTSASW